MDLQTINTIGLGLVAIYNIYDRFFSENSRIKKEIIESYKTRIDQLIFEKNEEIRLKQEQIDLKHKCEEKVHSQSLLVAARDATIIEKDKQLEEQKEALAFRNPDVMVVLSETRELYKKLIEFMQAIYDYMKTTNSELKHQTDLLEKGHARGEKIDEASLKHQGEIMRTPGNTLHDDDNNTQTT